MYILDSDKKFESHIFAFSAMSTPKGKFQFYKILKMMNVDYSLINDKNNNWYLNGIPNLSTDQFKAAEKLKSKSQSNNNIYIGSSMGGYGALLYGSINKAQWVICFGSEIKLNIPYSRSYLHSAKKDIHASSVEILNRSTKYVFFVGEDDVIDMYNASLLPQHENIYIRVLSGSGHNVTEYINKHIISIDELLSEIILNNEKIIDSVSTQRIDQNLTKSEIELLYNAYCHIRNRHAEDAINALQRVESKFRLRSLLFNLFMGMAETRRRRPAAAIPWLKRAYGLSKCNRDVNFELAMALKQTNNHDESMAYYRNTIKIDNKYAPAMHHLALIYESKGMYSDAVAILTTATSISKEQKYQSTLSRISKIQANKNH